MSSFQLHCSSSDDDTMGDAGGWYEDTPVQEMNPLDSRLGRTKGLWQTPSFLGAMVNAKEGSANIAAQMNANKAETMVTEAASRLTRASQQKAQSKSHKEKATGIWSTPTKQSTKRKETNTPSNEGEKIANEEAQCCTSPKSQGPGSPESKG